MKHFPLALLCATSVSGLQNETEILLPSPLGKYNVAKTQRIIPHITLHDPVAPPQWNGTGRFLLISIYYPTSSAFAEDKPLQYLDSHLASYFEKTYNLSSGTLSKIYTPIQLNTVPLPGPVDQNALPTVLLSAGASNPCVWDTVLSIDLASQGYTVVCIDHPGEMAYLQLPDGTGIEGKPFDETWEAARAVYSNRVPDTLALLEYWPKLVQEHGWPFNTSTYVSVGHSVGGNAAVAALAYDKSIIGGINMDGAVVADNTTDVKTPFLFLAAEDHTADNDETWELFFGSQSGEWEVLNVQGTRHSDFTDLPILAEILGVGKVKLGLGPIKGLRIREVTTKFVSSFFDYILGKEDGPLDGDLPSEEWPEVIRNETSRG